MVVIDDNGMVARWLTEGFSDGKQIPSTASYSERYDDDLNSTQAHHHRQHSCEEQRQQDLSIPSASLDCQQ